ncbi:hypothetical protein Lfu02_36070 [Longispora fulva]|uniref:Uncharacterized protein YqjF (DUF2071 family) n=1 Tax=Longispora fulva TaxID=619741 RepID=A0A8J7KUA4_9ACTN|nr:DUF2071 domain-containing protein [Longispora fulva]MBG6141612.1 uncharacterized protein YqjF (DUF2071 family) [Longispora fulva]GIG59235.1 hypothetical protein Lfu02_36070 [Longispora fulva]
MVEPVTRLAPRPLRGTILAQGWRDLTMLHWPVDPAAVAPLLPRGTVPDTLDGVTYVGLVPFRMVGVSLGPWPPVPYLGTFAETNVRLYSVDAAGRRGVVFRSLEAARLVPVLAARWVFRLPYMWAAMRIRRDGDTVAYETRRRWPGPVGVGGRVVVRIGDRMAGPSPVEEFLTARWGLHVDWHGRTAYLPNAHEEWPLHRAELVELSDGLVAAAGLPGVAGPPVSVLWSPGVRARFGRPLGAAARRVGDAA